MKKGNYHTPGTIAKIRAGMMGKKNAEGYKHTPEQIAKQRAGQGTPGWRAKQSTALMGNKNSQGYKHTLETREKMRAVHTNPREETRAKMRASAIGRKASPKARANIAASKRGSSNPNWRGGFSRKVYSWTFNEELKEEVRRRDGHKCQLCGAPQSECGAALSVHHINYNKRDSDPLNLISLCRSCHLRTNVRRKYWTAYFAAREADLFEGRE